MRGAAATLTPGQAQALHDAAQARGEWGMWFVSTADPARPGKAVAWAIVADPSGGTRLPGVLISDTIEELRRMLPAGLKRGDRASVMPPEVVEIWD
jgi:hypothetical protein